jgi:uncharacterized protein YkwD
MTKPLRWPSLSKELAGVICALYRSTTPRRTGCAALAINFAAHLLTLVSPPGDLKVTIISKQTERKFIMTQTKTQTLFSIALASILTACGGGGGDTSTGQPSAAQPTSPVVVVPVVAPTGNDFSSRHPVTAVPAPTYVASSFQLTAFNRINAIRSSLGLGLFAQNAALDASAQAHADYLKVNGSGDGHVETSGRAGFTGARAGDRMTRAGYNPSSWAEDMSFGRDGAVEIDGLVAAIYHRIPLLSFKTKDIGVGYVQTSVDPDPRFNTYANVFNMAYSGAAQGAQMLTSILWPADNSTTTSTSMPSELPRPGIPGAGGVFGYPVSISVDEDRVLVPTTFTLSDNTGATVLCNLLSYSIDANLVTYNAKAFVALVPRDPLKSASTYTVQFVGTLDGAPFTRTWSFKTP